MNERKNSFILYNSFYEPLTLLSAKDRGDLLLALFEYEATGAIQTPLAPIPSIAFAFVRAALDRDREAYEETCRRNRENGKKGGRPPKESSEQKTAGLSEKPKKPDIDMDMDIENDIDIDMDMDMDMEVDMEVDMEIEMEKDIDMEVEEEKDCGAVQKGSPCGSAAPVSQFAPQDAPPTASLSEQEEAELIKKGIPLDYAILRLERARSYAVQRRVPVTAVLGEWWQKDQKDQKTPALRPAPQSPPPPPKNKSKTYDVDDFWQAALERSYRELGMIE